MHFANSMITSLDLRYMFESTCQSFNFLYLHLLKISHSKWNENNVFSNIAALERSQIL